MARRQDRQNSRQQPRRSVGQQAGSNTRPQSGARQNGARSPQQTNPYPAQPRQQGSGAARQNAGAAQRPVNRQSARGNRPGQSGYQNQRGTYAANTSRQAQPRPRQTQASRQARADQTRQAQSYAQAQARQNRQAQAAWQQEQARQAQYAQQMAAEERRRQELEARRQAREKQQAELRAKQAAEQARLEKEAQRKQAAELRRQQKEAKKAARRARRLEKQRAAEEKRQAEELRRRESEERRQEQTALRQDAGVTQMTRAAAQRKAREEEAKRARAQRAHLRKLRIEQIEEQREQNRGRGLPMWARTMIGVAAVLVLAVMFFRVQEFEVSGNVRYSEEEIADASGITKGDVLLAVGKGRTASRLLVKLPYVEEVRISKTLPGRVSLQVKECQAVTAARAETGTLWLLSAEGKILEKVDSADEIGYPIIQGAVLDLPVPGDQARFTDEEKGKAAMAAVLELQAAGLLEKVNMVNVSETGSLSLAYEARVDVDLGDGSDLGYKLQYMIGAMERLSAGARGGLDLSFQGGEKAVFHPLG